MAEVTIKHILKLLTDKFQLSRANTTDRLRLQKTVYLLQAHGLQLGYGFGWYKYGPYSQDLVYDAYSVLESESEHYAKECQPLEFVGESLEKLNRFSGILGKNLHDLRMLEMIASVDFICRTWRPDTTVDNIAERFRGHKKVLFDKKPFEDKEIQEAFCIHKNLRAIQN